MEYYYQNKLLAKNKPAFINSTAACMAPPPVNSNNQIVIGSFWMKGKQFRTIDIFLG